MRATTVAPRRDARAVPSVVDPRQVPDWDQQVARLGGGVFHSAGWARTLAQTYGYAPQYHVLQRRELSAVLPVFEVSSWLTGRRGIALPFTDACDPLADEPADVPALFERACETGRRRGWRTLEVRGARGRLAPAPASVTFHTHLLDLRRSEAELFARLEASNRRAIRRAQSAGVVVEFSNDRAALDAFYRLLCRTRRKHGVPPQPHRFFVALHTELLNRKQGCIALARLGDRIVAGAVYLHFQQSAVYKFGASDEAFLPCRANNLVMWEAIRAHARQGFDTLDLGRSSSTNHGLRAFKRSFGADERILEYVKYDLRRGAFTTDQDRSSGWHSHLFRHLPIVVSRAIGAALYKHIA